LNIEYNDLINIQVFSIMKEFKANELDGLVKHASQALSDSQNILKELLEDSEFADATSEDTILLFQLVLQYRLDAQSALTRLLQVNKLLFQILGIEPQSSFDKNMERMAYALGNDDLHHVLYSLSQLVNSLSLIANRYKKTRDKEYQQKHNPHSKPVNPRYAKVNSQLQKAITFQKHSFLLIEKLESSLQELTEGIVLGPILDHIAALRGPISQFFLAEQSGLELSYNLYVKINFNHQLTDTVSEVLEQANLILKQLPPDTQHYHLFTPEKVDTSGKLEQRASMKRLGNYFSF
jgi:hypothetical protein